MFLLSGSRNAKFFPLIPVPLRYLRKCHPNLFGYPDFHMIVPYLNFFEPIEEVLNLRWLFPQPTAFFDVGVVVLVLLHSCVYDTWTWLTFLTFLLWPVLLVLYGFKCWSVSTVSFNLAILLCLFVCKFLHPQISIIRLLFYELWDNFEVCVRSLPPLDDSLRVNLHCFLLIIEWVDVLSTIWGCEGIVENSIRRKRNWFISSEAYICKWPWLMACWTTLRHKGRQLCFSFVNVLCLRVAIFTSNFWSFISLTFQALVLSEIGWIKVCQYWWSTWCFFMHKILWSRNLLEWVELSQVRLEVVLVGVLLAPELIDH